MFTSDDFICFVNVISILHVGFTSKLLIMIDAINAARQSNANEMGNLQQQLDEINRNIEDLTEKHRELEKENAVLQ